MHSLVTTPDRRFDRRVFLPMLSVMVATLAFAVSPSSFAKQYTMTIAYLYPPKLSSNGQAPALTHFKQLVESETHGDIKVKLFPNGQLGSEVQTAKEAEKGITVQSTLISTGAMSSFLKKYQLMDTPFLFPNYDTAWAFFNSKWFAKFMSPTIKKDGLRYLGTFDDGGGYVAFTNNKHLIKTMSDLKGLNIRVEENPADIEIMKSLGANATPLAWGQVHTALATGLADGQFNAPGTNAAFKLWDVTKYTTWAGLVYNTVTWLVSEKWFSSLPNKDQRIIVDAARESVHMAHGVAARVSLSGWKESCEHFKKCYMLPPSEREKWRNVARPAFKKWITAKFGLPSSEVDSFWNEVHKVSQEVARHNEVYMQQ